MQEQESKDKVTIGLRLGSMLLDHFIMTFIIFLCMIPWGIMLMINAFDTSPDPSTSYIGMGAFWCVFVMLFVYFNKDGFNGRSPAKRILKMQVIDVKTGLAASPLKCYLRNIGILLWPFEVIMVIINPKQRLGDKLAGTRIDYVEQPAPNKMRWSQFFIPLFISLGITTVVTFPLMMLTSAWSINEVDYLEESYNVIHSKATNEVFKTELDSLIIEAEFKIYDIVKNDDRKYVSGALYFNNQADFDNFDALELEIKTFLTAKFPLESHICFLKYIHKENGSITKLERNYVIE